MCIISSVIVTINIRKYWNNIIEIDLVKEKMNQKRFEQFRLYLHFNDNNENKKGFQFYRLRPVLDWLKKKFQFILMEEMLSLDEQLCVKRHGTILRIFATKTSQIRLQNFHTE